MAAPSVSPPGSTGTSLGFDDYSLYGNLSDEELIQLAIERSLADAQSAAPAAESIKASVAQNKPSPAVVEPTPSHPPQRNNTPSSAVCPINPPKYINTDLTNCTISHFITGYGQRMIAYRQADGTLVCTKPEEEAKVDPLVIAIWNGDVATLRTLVRQPGTDMLQANNLGWLPIHEAAYYGQARCLRILIEAHTGTVNKRTLRDQTALMLAVSRDHSECVTCLLESGADPDITNKDKETPLFKACEKENAEILASLLNYGAGVNKLCIQGWTALHEAVYRNNLEICEMLVRAGAKVSLKDKYGLSPLFVAAQSGHLETLRFLVKNGADINSEATDGATALYEACKNGHEDIVEFLISQNADANKPGKSGLLPIHIAAQKGNDGKNLLNFTYYTNGFAKSVKIVSMLIKVTNKVRVRRSGISPLHLAAEHNRDEVLEVLIEAGYDVNAKLSEDWSKRYEDRRSSALYFAVVNNNIEATTMLLEAGANPNLDTLSPLLVAIRQGCIRTVTMLVEHGANVNFYIPSHPTTFPATVMFAMKYLPMLKYLMDNGCDALSCFSCSYGSDPHPPLEVSQDRRGVLSNRPEIPSNTCVQFCEVISTPSICRWAGPIIDVLLDYVGDVKLCARLIEHLDSYSDWTCIKEKATPPRTLMQLCRLRIYKLLGTERLCLINTLPVPVGILRFLRHEERTQDF
ncbi:ankyrin repeat and SOCS box protein 2 [Denticeps clupeoides]|uniref:SOCS box domain-containing protein n=1 Tax=Denticeps clupeoides TaxID=299321 RepID=A0AAY4D8N9_9TELE|nr:ankyrin repeat and SOCS box protein 2-like [Denticeps clupeoides]